MVRNEIKVKELIVKVIPSSVANAFVRKYHYSGKVVPNSSLHFGVFHNNILLGVMSFGSPMSRRKVINLVIGKDDKELEWNSMLELNRMAFSDLLPKNSESRTMAIAFRLIKKNAPHIKWILSFSDGTASGDGTIYRASGFHLTQINSNKSILVFPDGERVASVTLTNGGDLQSRVKYAKKYGATLSAAASVKPFLDIGAKWAEGYQLRYIKLLSDDVKLNCPLLSYDEIQKQGAGMYLGEKR